MASIAKIVASVLLKLLIDGNGKCLTIETPSESAELYIKPKQHTIHEPRGLEIVKLCNKVVENIASLPKTIGQQLPYKYTKTTTTYDHITGQCEYSTIIQEIFGDSAGRPNIYNPKSTTYT